LGGVGARSCAPAKAGEPTVVLTKVAGVISLAPRAARHGKLVDCRRIGWSL